MPSSGSACLDVASDLPTKLLSKTESVDTARAVKGKVIGLYFAEFTPPCLDFTARLESVYRALKARGCPFEVILVSKDRDDGDFQRSYKTMPWLAVPFHDPYNNNAVPEMVLKLANKFCVRAAPHLVLIGGGQEEGGGGGGRAVSGGGARGAGRKKAQYGTEVLCDDAAHIIAGDPEGMGFPWEKECGGGGGGSQFGQGPPPGFGSFGPGSGGGFGGGGGGGGSMGGGRPASMSATVQTVSQIIGNDFQWKDGTPGNAKQDLGGKTVTGILFSRSGDHACERFHETLADVYLRLKYIKGRPFEVVFVSQDDDAAGYEKSMSQMTWLSVPFGDTKRRAELSRHFARLALGGGDGSQVNAMTAANLKLDPSKLPILAMVDSDGARSVISLQSTGSVNTDPEGTDFPWRPKPYFDVNADAGLLNTRKGLVLLTDGMAKADREAAIAVLEKLACADSSENNRGNIDGSSRSGAPGISYFYASPLSNEEAVELKKSGRGPNPVSVIRQRTNHEYSRCSHQGAAIMMLDIPDRGAYYVAGHCDMSEEALLDFVQDHEKTGRKQMSAAAGTVSRRYRRVDAYYGTPYGTSGAAGSVLCPAPTFSLI